MFEQRSRDTSTLAMALFRLGLILAFLVMVARLYRLQIVEGQDFRQRADDNRFELVELPAPRGVIYHPGPQPPQLRSGRRARGSALRRS